jgi:hypothetical protein
VLLRELQPALGEARSGRRAGSTRPLPRAPASSASDPAETGFSGSTQTISAAAEREADQQGGHLTTTKTTARTAHARRDREHIRAQQAGLCARDQTAEVACVVPRGRGRCPRSAAARHPRRRNFAKNTAGA